MKIIALLIKVTDVLFQKSANYKRIAFNVVFVVCLSCLLNLFSFFFLYIYIIYVFIYIHYICIVSCTYVCKKL